MGKRERTRCLRHRLCLVRWLMLPSLPSYGPGKCASRVSLFLKEEIIILKQGPCYPIKREAS